MDTRDNQFKHIENPSEEDKQFLIPFNIGDKITVKDYPFEIESVDVETNRLVLKPIAVTKQQRTDITFKKEIAKLKAKGGLGA